MTKKKDDAPDQAPPHGATLPPHGVPWFLMTADDRAAPAALRAYADAIESLGMPYEVAERARALAEEFEAWRSKGAT